MRGKGDRFVCRRSLPGITPAYAGKSCFFNFLTFCVRDHPRVCGEKHHHQVCKGPCEGSPPRMRGKAVIGKYLKVNLRITPAYAGKRAELPYAPVRSRDHPRVCGEKKLEIISMHLVQGSPPRMRGKGQKTMTTIYSAGITPAYAGKRYRRAVGQANDRGSPPRMRGKASNSANASHVHGITPAYAGNSIHALLCVPAS